MRLTASDALRHPFIRQDDSSLPSPRIIIDQVSCFVMYCVIFVAVTAFCDSNRYYQCFCLQTEIIHFDIMQICSNVGLMFWRNSCAGLILVAIDLFVWALSSHHIVTVCLNCTSTNIFSYLLLTRNAATTEG